MMPEDQNPPEGPPNEPPIPPVPSGAPRCPACGREVMPGTVYCLHCGARLSTARPGALGVPGMIGLAFLALFLGGFGACTIAIGSPSLDNIGQSLIFVVPGLGALYLAFLCLRRIVRAVGAHRDRPQ